MLSTGDTDWGRRFLGGRQKGFCRYCYCGSGANVCASKPVPLRETPGARTKEFLQGFRCCCRSA